MIPFINVHTHRKPGNREWAIRFGWLPNAGFSPKKHGYFISAGLHPWWAHTLSEEEITKRISELLKSYPIIALGEMGLDRVKGPDFRLQEKIFTIQLDLAVKWKKPVIIHCVRAYSDVYPHIKKQNTIPFILHDYSGNTVQTSPLLQLPNVYFSLGKILFRNPESAQMLLHQIPKNRLFLETDTMPLSIEEIYRRAAELKKKGMEQLVYSIFENAKGVFDFSV